MNALNSLSVNHQHNILSISSNGGSNMLRDPSDVKHLRSSRPLRNIRHDSSPIHSSEAPSDIRRRFSKIAAKNDPHYITIGLAPGFVNSSLGTLNPDGKTLMRTGNIHSVPEQAMKIKGGRLNAFSYCPPDHPLFESERTGINGFPRYVSVRDQSFHFFSNDSIRSYSLRSDQVQSQLLNSSEAENASSIAYTPPPTTPLARSNLTPGGWDSFIPPGHLYSLHNGVSNTGLNPELALTGQFPNTLKINGSSLSLNMAGGVNLPFFNSGHSRVTSRNLDCKLSISGSRDVIPSDGGGALSHNNFKKDKSNDSIAYKIDYQSKNHFVIPPYSSSNLISPDQEDKKNVLSSNFIPKFGLPAHSAQTLPLVLPSASPIPLTCSFPLGSGRFVRDGVSISSSSSCSESLSHTQGEEAFNCSLAEGRLRLLQSSKHLSNESHPYMPSASPTPLTAWSNNLISPTPTSDMATFTCCPGCTCPLINSRVDTPIILDESNTPILVCSLPYRSKHRKQHRANHGLVPIQEIFDAPSFLDSSPLETKNIIGVESMSPPPPPLASSFVNVSSINKKTCEDSTRCFQISSSISSLRIVTEIEKQHQTQNKKKSILIEDGQLLFQGSSPSSSSCSNHSLSSLSRNFEFSISASPSPPITGAAQQSSSSFYHSIESTLNKKNISKPSDNQFISSQQNIGKANGFLAVTKRAISSFIAPFTSKKKKPHNPEDNSNTPTYLSSNVENYNHITSPIESAVCIHCHISTCPYYVTQAASNKRRSSIGMTSHGNTTSNNNKYNNNNNNNNNKSSNKFARTHRPPPLRANAPLPPPVIANSIEALMRLQREFEEKQKLKAALDALKTEEQLRKEEEEFDLIPLGAAIGLPPRNSRVLLALSIKSEDRTVEEDRYTRRSDSASSMASIRSS